MVKLGNWHDKIGTSYENSPHREAPNKHTRGGKKYKEMIDRDTKNADRFKNLPFTISKPPKRTQPRRDIFMICDVCQCVDLVSKYTAGKICGKCHKYTSVNATNTYKTEEELELALEALGGEYAQEQPSE